MKRVRMARAVIAACGLLLLASCERQTPETAPLLLEEPSPSFLRQEIEDAISEYDQADADLSMDPEEAQRSFARARERLNHINSYYLPLLEARERAYNAYQLCAHGDVDRASNELGLVEELLMGVAKTEAETVRSEFEAPLSALEGAKLALEGDSGQATAEIAELVRELNDLLYKGRLVEE